MAISPVTNDIVDFQLVKNGIVGDARTGAVVIVGDMTYQAAKTMDQQLNIKHTNLFAYFKDKIGGVDDPAAYRYFAVQLTNGQMEVIGYPWVNESTYKIVKGRTRSYTFTNFEMAMEGPLHKVLRDLGMTYTYNDVTR
ncbi:hypothetical protein D3C81_375870 [compost metagenome]